MFKPINHEQSTELSPQPGLEYWFKERRTFIDFRRGPLGPHFDGFADDVAQTEAGSRLPSILTKSGMALIEWPRPPRSLPHC